MLSATPSSLCKLRESPLRVPRRAHGRSAVPVPFSKKVATYRQLQCSLAARRGTTYS
jgi:hypothetical protein